MKSKTNGMKRIIGWPASIALAILYGVTEWLCCLIGGDLGSFMVVTLHFIVMPVMSIALIVVTVVLSFRERGWFRRFILLSSLLLPSLIILIAVSGEPGLLRFFGPMHP